MVLAGCFIHTNVDAAFLVALAVVVDEPLLGAGILGRELVAGSQHLLHQQAGRDRLEHVVHGLGHGGLLGCRLGDQVGEA